MLKLKLSRQTISKTCSFICRSFGNAVLVGINYIFFSMTTNKSLEKQNYGSVLIQLMNIGLVFTLAITFFFMIYINGIVSRRRNHELGLYSILGMTRSDLGKMIFFIDAIMFVASSVLGLVFGATFVKFVGLGLKNCLIWDALIFRYSAPLQQSSASDILQPCILYCSWATYGAYARSTRLTCGRQRISEKKNRAAHGSSESSASSHLDQGMRLQSE